MLRNGTQAVREADSRCTPSVKLIEKQSNALPASACPNLHPVYTTQNACSSLTEMISWNVPLRADRPMQTESADDYNLAELVEDPMDVNKV